MTDAIRLAPHPDRDTAAPRHLLRAATRSAHDRVDAAFGAFDMATAEGYRRFLSAHQAVLPPLERSLAASSVEGHLADWPSRCRSEALAADLRDLGVDASADGGEASVAALSPAEVMGALYVLEGSRLGGAILARQVDAAADPRCRTATRYLLHGEGERLWPSFVSYFNASDVVRHSLPEVIAAARHTFSLFETAARDVAARFPEDNR